LRRAPGCVTIGKMEAEPIIYRAEITAVLGALADIIVELREIRKVLQNGEEEEEDTED
jgi:hypothetical protein